LINRSVFFSLSLSSSSSALSRPLFIPINKVPRNRKAKFSGKSADRSTTCRPGIMLSFFHVFSIPTKEFFQSLIAFFGFILVQSTQSASPGRTITGNLDFRSTSAASSNPSSSQS
jgi:hypothetical protein